MSVIDRPDALAATAVENGIVAVSLELSRSKWLVTSLLPGSEKLSKHMIAAGDGAALLSLLERRRRQAEERVGGPVRVVAIEEAGLDGFWLHRLLEANGIESHVVDAASVAVPRRRRRGKSDGIDGETLLRTLLAWRRGEPRVCSMVRPPRPQEEDRRRVVRERAVLIRERIAITNRVRGLLMSQGITDYQPLRRDRRARLETLVTGDGRALAPQMKRELERALDRLDLVVQQLKAVEAERDAMQEAAASEAVATDDRAQLLLRLRAIGPQTAAVLTLEAFYRHFDNRRQVAAFAGLSPSPWQSGAVVHDQGISKAGQPQLRKAMVELAWLWRRHQPGSALSRWYAAARPGPGRPSAARADRRPRPQAAGRAVALRQRRRRSRGRRLQGRLSRRAQRIGEARSASPDPGGRRRMAGWLQHAADKTGPALPEPDRRDHEDYGTAVTATGCEVLRHRRRSQRANDSRTRINPAHQARPDQASLAPGSPPSRPLRAASGGGLRPALTAPAHGAPPISWSGRRGGLPVEQRGAHESIALDPHILM